MNTQEATTAEQHRVSTRGASENRLEVLIFDLGGRQKFGINVLKIQEIITCPPLTRIPHADPAVKGLAQLRDHSLTVIDLAQAIGRTPLHDDTKKPCNGSLIITEFSRNKQGFLVNKVDRIAVCDWQDVLPPPHGTGLGSYITGVTDINGEILQILDVERVSAEIVRHEMHATPVSDVDDEKLAQIVGKRVLVVDDSSLARTQTNKFLEILGIDCVLANDGQEALDILRELNSGDNEKGSIDMLISDIEMPQMDGYTLTSILRGDPLFADLYILLHTSLTGAINSEKAKEVGANASLTKFDQDDLTQATLKGLLKT
jgi:two-component system chemotaxis response regulator CheV